MNSYSTEKKDIRKFGAIAFLFFGALFALAFWRHRVAVTWFFGILSFFGICLLVFPVKASPIYRGWMTVAHLIGKTITVIVLTIAYYLVITPSALLKRIFGGRPLPVTPDREAESYWVTREEPAQPRERFIKRY